MYLMTCTRPDLVYPLSVLSRFVGPGRHRLVHWTAAVRVAKYLATTSGMGLVLGGTRPVELTGLCDSSYADDVETQRSTQEAEIYASAMAAQEFRWLTFLLADLGERPHTALTLFTDNKAMILLCREPRLETRVKHIDVRYFLLRELQRRGQVRLDFEASEANTADLFTKALAPGDHHRFCVQLGLVEAGPRLLQREGRPGGGACVGAAAPGAAAPGPRDVAPGPHGADPAAACDAVPGPCAAHCRPLLPVPVLPVASLPPPSPFFVSLLRVQPWNGGPGGGGYGGDGWYVSLPLILLSFPLLQLPLGGGCEGVGEPGEWHWGGGCETNQPPSL
ncbi:unnamed protein product [Closterium sp. NIES-53]